MPIWGWLGLRRETNLHGRGYWVRPLVVEVLAALALRGTRTAPVLDDGTAVGADGTFLSWDEAVLTAWRTGERV